MELTKNDIKMTKGLAIIFMVLLHLFCQKDFLPYEPLLFIGDIPLVYYIGLFGDCCVVIYCFCSGYAHYIINTQKERPYISILKRLPFFLIQFWIICIVFSLIGLIVKDPSIPGSLSIFAGNILLYRLSYNGAWWFVQTYIILCLISPIIIKLCKKSTTFSIILFSAVYFISYLVRFDKIQLLQNVSIFSHLSSILAPFGTSLLPYAVGMLFYKHSIFTRLYGNTNKIKPIVKNLLLLLCILIMFIMHCIVETLFVAIFTGLGVVVCFNLWNKGKATSSFFSFLGAHSTNIWLTHMFFYLVLFKDFVFIFKYPILCFAFMIGITVFASTIINFILKQVNSITPLKRLK